MIHKLFSFLLLLLLTGGTTAWTKDLTTHASEWKQKLTEDVLPYWHDTTQDKTYGGYLLADDGKGNGEAQDKALVAQARMVWSFAHAQVHGFKDYKRDYLKAAEQGYLFLTDHFLDKKHGGYYWRTDLEGNVLDDRKVLYGEVFVIYALVEYYLASGDPEALARAMDLYRTLQEHAYDSQHGGWLEHFERPWKPLLTRESGAPVEVPGYKSANAHLHLMEALSELYQVTGDKDVKQSLLESLRINQNHFYPKDAGQSVFHRKLDWQTVTDPGSAGLSYGHNVEFAWLMLRAQEVLEIGADWPHFWSHIDHALEYGYDHNRGGLYYLGHGNQPATRTDKIWWVQAEMVAALSDALKQKPAPPYKEALLKQIEFIETYQADPKDGIWFDTVTAEGSPTRTAKANGWKTAYHDFRAMVKFIEALETSDNN